MLLNPRYLNPGHAVTVIMSGRNACAFDGEVVSSTPTKTVVRITRVEHCAPDDQSIITVGKTVECFYGQLYPQGETK